MDQKPPESEISANGLPRITQETRDKLLDELGLAQNKPESTPLNQHATDALMREMIDLQSGATGRTQVEKSHRAEAFALSALDDVADVNPELLRTLQSAVQEGIGYDDGSKPDAFFVAPYARGIGVILKAFHTNSDYRLIPDLSKLTPLDISRIGQIVSSNLREAGGMDSHSDPFTKALNRPRIPASQQFLRDVVEAPTQMNHSMFDADYRTGAAVMYKAMNVIWDRLYPSGQSSQGSNEPPSSPSVQPPQSPQI